MKKCRFYILIAAIIYLLAGCKFQRDQEVKLEKKDKAPDNLGNIASGIQAILNNTEDIEKLMDLTYLDEKELKDKEKDREEEGNSDSEGQNGENGEDKKEGKEEKEEDKPPTPKEKEEMEEDKRQEEVQKNWRMVSKKIENVHKQWNSFETEDKKTNINADKVDKFRNSLNTLTKSIENKNIIDIYENGSKSLLDLSPFFDLYKDEIGGDINRIRQAVYLSYIRFKANKPEEASLILKKVEENTNNIRLKLNKDDSKMAVVDKVNLAIKDMEKSLKDRSLKLVRIKKDIILDQLKELEK